MKLFALSIRGFRGIQQADLRFGQHDVLVGPNGAGKSTIVDALSLVFGRTRLVRELTEHDLYGSRPEATSRIRIVATLAGFDGDDPERNDAWFREGRAVPKWWNSSTGQIEPEPGDQAETLCAQVAFAARFDLEELVVDSIRYFHDDDDVEDPFLDDAVQPIPIRLFDDIGYYVLPARRTWEAAASFASELFRKAVATVGGIPAQTILDERDRLRAPDPPLEESDALSPLADRINWQLAELLPDAPRFQLRLTATDSESLLRTLVPHYADRHGVSLPVGRHGMGLLSLQNLHTSARTRTRADPDGQAVSVRDGRARVACPTRNAAPVDLAGRFDRRADDLHHPLASCRRLLPSDRRSDPGSQPGATRSDPNVASTLGRDCHQCASASSSGMIARGSSRR